MSCWQVTCKSVFLKASLYYFFKAICWITRKMHLLSDRYSKMAWDFTSLSKHTHTFTQKDLPPFLANAKRTILFSIICRVSLCEHPVCWHVLGAGFQGEGSGWNLKRAKQLKHYKEENNHNNHRNNIRK